MCEMLWKWVECVLLDKQEEKKSQTQVKKMIDKCLIQEEQMTNIFQTNVRDLCRDFNDS